MLRWCSVFGRGMYQDEVGHGTCWFLVDKQTRIRICWQNVEIFLAFQVSIGKLIKVEINEEWQRRVCTCRLVKPSNTSYPIMIQAPPRPSTWPQLLRDRSSAAFPNDSNEAESLYPDAHFPQPLGERCGKRVRQYGAVSIFRQYSETPKSYSLAWCDTPEFGR